jgi:hypothetical protein
MDGLLSKLRNLDAYPKVNEDFYSRTLSGGIITLASSVFMLLLFVSELRTPLAPRFLPPTPTFSLAHRDLWPGTRFPAPEGVILTVVAARRGRALDVPRSRGLER